jgi:glycine/D-amino acid oxidase-like deaminating enzyme
VLWRGVEAFQEALVLLEAAEAAIAAETSEQARGVRRPFVWRHGMLRPARSAKQARDIARFLPADPAAAAATGAAAVTDPAALAALVPGLQPEQLLPAEQLEQVAAAAPPAARARRRHPQQGQPAAAGPPAVGLMVGAGATVHPGSYMRALWLACQQAAAAAGPGSAATLRRREVRSLQELQAEEGPFDAIVVAAGAAAGSIAELQGVLPLELCHGHSLDMQPSSHDSSSGGSHGSGSGEPGSSGGVAGGGYPEGGPSLLGSPYIAAHGSGSLVVGATKRYGVTPEEALQQCGAAVVVDAGEAAAAADALLPAAAALWPPLAGWRVARVRAGVRALPTRGSDGAIPYAGCLPAAEDLPSCWVVGGLGARGLVYHAWLGKLVAAAVAAGSDEALPPELLRWKMASDVCK